MDGVIVILPILFVLFVIFAMLQGTKQNARTQRRDSSRMHVNHLHKISHQDGHQQAMNHHNLMAGAVAGSVIASEQDQHREECLEQEQGGWDDQGTYFSGGDSSGGWSDSGSGGDSGGYSGGDSGSSSY